MYILIIHFCSTVNDYLEILITHYVKLLTRSIDKKGIIIVMFSLDIYFSSIVKQVPATYINHSLVRFLEPTSTGAV